MDTILIVRHTKNHRFGLVVWAHVNCSASGTAHRGCIQGAIDCLELKKKKKKKKKSKDPPLEA